MRGAIAAGHPLTAEAGARVLAEGGFAVDACIAASFASWVCESMLCGPGAGGFFLVHEAGSGRTRLADFFVCEPGLGRAENRLASMEQVDVSFEPDSSQAFSIGAASCAVPGASKGLEEVHRRFGKLPWRELIAPAIELARRGVEITPAQDFLHQILDPILRHGAEGRRVYELEGRRYQTGDVLRLPDLAGTLEQLAAEGAGALYGGELGRRLVAYMEERGREDHSRRHRALSLDLAPAGALALPGLRVRLQPASFLGRHPRRLRATASG